MVYWTSPCIDHIPKVFFQYVFFSKELSHKKQLSRPKLNYCPVRNVSDGTFFNIHYLKSEIFLNYFLCIIWSSHVLRRKIMNILFIKRLVCELLKLFVPMHHRSDKNDYWTYFCKDHIDIHQQIYGTLDLSLYRSYSQSVFFSTFFSKELSHKNNCPVRNEMLRFFFPENHNFHIYAPIMLVWKVVFLVIELFGNTMHGIIC